MIKEAEGQAEAVLKVQKANAEGLRMIKRQVQTRQFLP